MWLKILALVLIIEGILPFLAPKAVKQIASEVLSRPEKHIQLYGFCLLISGIVILFMLTE